MSRWLPIPGYAGFEASDDGRIRRLRPGRRPYVLLTHEVPGGYQRVKISIEGVARNVLVHRLVALAFLGPCPDGHQVNHLDGDTAHNAPRNLEYVTPSENVRHSFDVLGRDPARGEGHASAVLTASEVLELRRRFREGETKAALAEEKGVAPSTVGRAVEGKTWSHVGAADAS